MAKLFPDSEKTRVIFASSAEEIFYKQCRELSAGWRIYHSCTLSMMEGNSGLKDNEIDFVAYHPKFGVVAIEVKGGRIRFDQTKSSWFSVNRHGECFSIKDPFLQVLTWKSRFLRFLRNQNVKVPVSHAVCFPVVSEDDIPVSAGVARDIIIGREKLKDLEESLKAIAKMSQPSQYLNFKDCAVELDKLLVGTTFTTKLHLKDYLERHENRVRDVESIHETLLTPISASKRMGIEGEAGTGKTMLAIMLARHCRDQGQKVILLTSSPLLNLYMQDAAGTGIRVISYPQLASSYGINLLIPPKDYEGKKEDWVQYEAPDRLKKAILASESRYDAVLCDEAQDVQPFWWEAFESLQDVERVEENRFYLFFDRSQGVFGSGESHFVPEEVLPVPAPYFPLVHNYRTTREIAAFSRSFRTGKDVFQSHCGRIGYIPELIVYKDAEDARKKLKLLVNKLTVEEGIESNEMTIISARNPAAKESVLYDQEAIDGRPLHRLTHTRKEKWEDVAAPSGSIPMSTIAGFKGLETHVGILMNLSEYNLPLENPIMSSMIYVACTRAKHMLYIFVQKDDEKKKHFEKALKKIKNSGSMIINGADSDFEFTGVVTHYNPERVGWLSVEDPAFEQGNVMFFPHDVSMSELKDLTVGTKVKFRPRAEGHATIASDLKLNTAT
jgi:hypothetical protein